MSDQESSKPTQKSGTTLPGNQGGQLVETKGFGIEERKQSAELAAIHVAAKAKANVEAAFIMAIKNPRNEETARTRIMNRCKDPRFAECAKYRKPVGKIKVERGQWVQNYVNGLSIRFAEDMIRLWGNIRATTTVLYDDDFKRVITVDITDLESNVHYDQDITIQKLVERKNGAGREIVSERVNSYNERVFIVKATEDELQQKIAALVSKAIRTQGLRCIPGYIKDEASDLIDGTRKAGVMKDPEAEKRKIADAFNSLGISPKEMEKYVGQSISTLSPAQIEELRNDYNAIKDGETTWAELLESKKEDEKKQPEAAQGVLSDLEPGDQSAHQHVEEKVGGSKARK